MESPVKKRVMLVIPVHNRPQELAQLLSSLRMLDCEGIDFAISIVDDGSAQPVRQAIADDCKGLNLTFFRNQAHRGPAYCRNMATRDFNGDYVWFLDSDTEILNSRTLAAMINRLESDAAMAGTGGAIEKFKEEKKVVELDFLRNFLFVCRTYPPQSYKPAYVKGIGSNNLILKRHVFELAGGFSEDFIRDEDNDLCLSVRRLGYHFYQDVDTLVLHKFSASGRQSGAFEYFVHPELYIKKMFQTRIALVFKHRPWLLLVLPFMDAALVPLVFYRVSRGTYTGRAATLASKDSLSTPAWLYLLSVQSLKSYVTGIGLFMGKMFSRNFFLSRISRADMLYGAAVKLPGRARQGLAKRYAAAMRRRINSRGFPDRITIFVTDQCNMRCLHCFIVKQGRPKTQSMGAQEYRRFFSKSSGKLSHVLFTGGEPTLRKDFPEILALAGTAGRCPSASIFTNGFLQEQLLDAVQRALKETRLTLSLQFSVDGLEQFHDSNRGVKGSLKNALSTIAAVTDIRKRFPGRFARIAAATIISKANMNSLPEIISAVGKTKLLHAFDFVRGSGVSVFNLKHPEELSGHQPDGFDGYLTSGEMEDALKVINSEMWSKMPDNLFYSTNRAILYTIKDTLKNGRPMAACMAGMADLILMPDGGIARCEMLKSCANLKDFNWDLAALISSHGFKKNYEKTRGCYCTHACAIGTAIMYDKNLLGFVLSGKRTLEPAL